MALKTATIESEEALTSLPMNVVVTLGVFFEDEGFGSVPIRAKFSAVGCGTRIDCPRAIR